MLTSRESTTAVSSGSDSEPDDPQDLLRGRMRSDLCRFTEFRTSLCVAQFAASFTGSRAEASTTAMSSFTAGTRQPPAFLPDRFAAGPKSVSQ